MQQQHPPVVLNPFRTPNQQLHHHLQHQRNVNSKDGTNGIMVVNSWIENPILRICYMMGITMLLICLLMVGYEAYRKSSIHAVPHTLGPQHQFSAAVTTTATTVTNPDGVPIPPNSNAVMNELEDIPEKIILPEILYKIPPKVARMIGRQPGLRSSSSTATEIVSPPQQNKKNGEQSVHHVDDELLDEDENEVDTTRHLSHDSITTTNTDDNVEQILRPKEVHSKLLGMAAKDFMQSAIQEEEQNNFHGFGEDIVVVVSPLDEHHTQSDKDTVTTTTTIDHSSQEEEDMDRVVVVLPPRKGEEFVKLSLIESKNNNNNNNMENTAAQQQPLPKDVSESKQESSFDGKDTLITTTARSRRLRHHVVAIPTPPRT